MVDRVLVNHLLNKDSGVSGIGSLNGVKSQGLSGYPESPNNKNNIIDPKLFSVYKVLINYCKYLRFIFCKHKNYHSYLIKNMKYVHCHASFPCMWISHFDAI